MKMITGAILILAAVVALGFACMRDQVVDRQLLALFGLVFLVVGVAYLIVGTISDERKK